MAAAAAATGTAGIRLTGLLINKIRKQRKKNKCDTYHLCCDLSQTPGRVMKRERERRWMRPL